MRRASAIAMLLMSAAAASAQDSTAFKPRLTVGGYLKFLHGTTWVNDIEELTTSELVHHRLNLRADIERHTTLRLEMRNRFFYGEAIKLQPGFGERIDTDTGRVRMSILWVDRPGAALLTTFDRALVRYARAKWEVHVGRQRINWGINTIWNPNDLFNAYNFLDFDYEERPGTDAVRAMWYPGTDRTLEAAFALGDGSDDHVGAMLCKFNRWKYDMQVLAGVYRTDLVLGGGWAGNIRDAGFKGEASWFLPKDEPFDSTGSFTASVMADHTFGNGWYVSASYLFNSLGNTTRDFRDPLLGLPLSAKQLIPFEHTFYTGFSKSFSPVTGMNASMMYSPYDATVVFFPALTWSVATGFDLDLTTLSFWNDDGTDWSVRSNAVYLRLRWSY